MATARKTKAPTTRRKNATPQSIDPRRLVFMREGKHVYSELVYVGATPRDAEIFAQGVNFGKFCDQASQEAFCGVDRELVRVEDRKDAQFAKA